MAFDTVSVGRCYSMAEAMMIRSLLGARGIEAIIPGLGLGALAATTGFSSQVLVPREHAEEAAALLVELREGQSESALAEAQEGEPSLAETQEGDSSLAEEDQATEASSALTTADPLEQAARRRRVAATLGIGLFLPFGTGHLLNGAPLRALGLALVQMLALRSLATGNPLAGLVIGAVLLTDLIGGSMLAWRGPSLPVARTITGNPGPREPLGP